MKCPRCKKGKATTSDQYGVLPCTKCQDEEAEYGAKRYPEFTTKEIKDQRREYRKDILQPGPFDGVLSKEYIEEYGTQGINATPKQVRDARYTNKGTPGWWDRDKSKGGRK